MEKTNRIAAFIEGLPMTGDAEDCQATLLSTNMEFMGGNGGNCINDLYEKCKKATNGGNCINYNSACPNSKNKGSCFSTIKEMPDRPAIGTTPNSNC